mmetsp:Transcript_34325/g.83444  ORF Transcript_34325/g.83444 Transcript_34325/m.83444 type:complete len:106 (+) Transcript_34325:256-573(+)
MSVAAARNVHVAAPAANAPHSEAEASPELVNVRIVVAALLYPNFYVTIFAGLVWRAKFWRFALDVKVLFAISMLLTIAFFVVLIALVDHEGNPCAHHDDEDARSE